MTDDLANLECLFSSYLNPLLETQVNISSSYTQKQYLLASRNSSSVVDHAEEFIKKHQTNKDTIGITSKAFKCMYRSPSSSLSPSQKIETFKKHQLFIVNLLDWKLFKECKDELEYVYFIIQKDFYKGENKSKIPDNTSWLSDGISILSEIPPNLAIAFNFLYLQFTLQSFSRRIRTENLNNLKSIVAVLLSTSNFSKWLNLSNSKLKHYTNLLKLMNGLVKIVDHIIAKKYWDEDETSVVKNSLSLKEIEFLLSIGNQALVDDNKVLNIINSLNFEDNLTGQCVLDLKQCLPKDCGLYLLLNKPILQDEIASEDLLPSHIISQIKQNPTPESILSIIHQHFQIHSFQSIESLLSRTTQTNLKILEIVVIYIEFSPIFGKSQLNLLDLITIQLKNAITTSLQITSPITTFRILSIAFNVLSNNQKFTRIRNISNLLYKLGNGPSIPSSLSLQCWKLCIKCEVFICKRESTTENGNILQNKLEKIVNFLYESEEFSALNQLMLEYLELISVEEESKNILESVQDFQKPLIIQLIAKCLSSNSMLVGHLWSENSRISETLRSTLYVKVLQFLEKSNDIHEKTSIINHITGSLFLKNEINQLVTSYYYLNITGLAEYLPVESLSLEKCEISTVQLFRSAVYFQIVLRDGWSSDRVNEFISYLRSWLLQDQLAEIEVEFGVGIMKKMLIFLHCNEMKQEAVELCQLSSNLDLSPLDKVYVNLMEARIEIKPSSLYLLKSTGDQLKSMRLVDISIQDILNWKLIQLDYCITLNDKDSTSKILSIEKFISSKLDFEDSSIPIQNKFYNLIMVARFRYLSGKYFHQKLNYLKSYENFRMVVKIIYSVIKRMNNISSMQNYFTIKWETNGLLINSYFETINALIKLGVSNDLKFYLESCESFLELANLSPKLNKLSWYKISNIYYLLDNQVNFLEFSAKASKFNFSEESKLSMEEELNKILSADSNNVTQSVFSGNQVKFKELLIISDYIHSLFLRPTKSCNDYPTESFCFEYYLILEWVLYYKELIGKSKSGIRGNPSSKTLVAAFDFFTNLTSSSSKLEHLSTYEVKDLVKSLLLSILLLSSSSAVEMKHEMVRSNSFKKMLFCLQDFSRDLPFAFEREIYREFPKGIAPQTNEISNGNGTSLLEVSLNSSMKLMDDLTEYLPKSWTIVSIDVCESSGDITFFKYQRGVLNYFRLSPDRWAGAEGCLSFQKLFEEFNEIIRLSSLSTKKEVTANVKSKEQRQNWWKNRFQLDLKLKNLLRIIELYWLGGFKGIFDSTPNSSNFAKLCKQVGQLFQEVLLKDHGGSILNTNEEFVHLLLKANSGSSSAELVGDVLRTTMLSFNSLSNHQIERLTIGLNTILRDYTEDISQEDCETHFVIIPSSNCSFIPWESLSFMKNKSVSRMPSVQGLLRVLKLQPKTTCVFNNPNQSPKVHYLINPEGDLKRTESTFGTKFRNLGTSWKGLVGEKPHDGQLLNDLLETDLFIYLGHGGCEQYIKTSELLKLTNSKDSKKNLLPGLLIGCSSGAISRNGLLEPHANVYDWMIGGAPMVMCNLWDVTDKDIDAFSSSVFEKWGLFGKDRDDNSCAINICQAVDQSRDACVLKHLNGCAPIVYGLPLYLKN